MALLASGPPFDLIFFDCDSTLCAIEGIDELARRAGVGAEVAELTRAAMDGAVPLEDVYGQRLELIRPDREAIDWLGARYVETEVKGAREVMAALHRLGKEVHIVSAGIRQAVHVLARLVRVPPSRVHAVDIHFDATGRYAGFDEGSPLARAGGKATVCEGLGAGARPAAMVGDGVTDLDAAAAGAYVIGFGGVVSRGIMRQRARRFVAEPSLFAVLDPLLSTQERGAVELEGAPLRSDSPVARGGS